MCVRPSVASDSLWPRGLSPTRRPCAWGSPGKSAGARLHSLLRRDAEPPPHPGRARLGMVRAGWQVAAVSPVSESVRVKGGGAQDGMSWLSQGSCLCHRRRRCPPGLGGASWLRKGHKRTALFQTTDTTLSSKVDWK